MKKTVLALCSALVIFACNVLTPMTVSAAERSCPPHTYHTTHTSTALHFLSSHPVFLENGPNGPIYGTCHIYGYYEEVHPKCSVCGYVDYSQVLSSTQIDIWHDSTDCPLHHELSH